MKVLAIIALIIAAATPSASSAQTVQLSTTRCSQYDQMGADQKKLIVTWLVGYYTGEQEADVISETRVNDAQAKLGEFCSKNPNFSLASAAEGLLDK